MIHTPQAGRMTPFRHELSMEDPSSELLQSYDISPDMIQDTSSAGLRSLLVDLYVIIPQYLSRRAKIVLRISSYTNKCSYTPHKYLTYLDTYSSTTLILIRYMYASSMGCWENRQRTLGRYLSYPGAWTAEWSIPRSGDWIGGPFFACLPWRFSPDSGKRIMYGMQSTAAANKLHPASSGNRDQNITLQYVLPIAKRLRDQFSPSFQGFTMQHKNYLSHLSPYYGYGFR